MQIHELNEKSLTDPAWVAFDDGTDTYKANFKDVIDDAVAEAFSSADVSGGEVVFDSSDEIPIGTWNYTDFDPMESHSTLKTLMELLSKVALNIRWFFNKLGTTSISSIGDGTVTGAISTINGNESITITAAANVTIASQSRAYLCGNKYIYLAVKGKATAAIYNAQLFIFGGSKNAIAAATMPIGIGPNEWAIDSTGYGYINAHYVTGTVPADKWFHINILVPTV